MTEGTYQWDPKNVPTIGKDHLVLADWRLSTPTRKWKQGSCGRETGVFTYQFERNGRKRQTVKMESGAATPFPSLNDDQFLIALLTLSAIAGCPAVLRFEPSHLLQLLCRSDNQGNLNRAHAALVRYQAMTTHFEGLWYDRSTRSVALDFSTGIIADLGWGSGKGRRKKEGNRSCRLQWTKSFHESLERGNLININLLDLTSLNQRTTAQQLFRMTNKAWHGGRKPSVLEMDVRDLACGHLRMKDTKYTRRNLLAVISFMERHGFYKQAVGSDRCYQVAHGTWRVRLEPHPDKIIRPAKSTRAVDAPSAKAQPAQLVEVYMRLRFGRSAYSPTAKEIACAERLLQEASFAELQAITSDVVMKVKSQNADDKYFGFAEPYYVQLLQEKRKQMQDSLKRTSGASRVDASASQRGRERKAKEARWKWLLAQWSKSSSGRQKQCIERALARDRKPAYCRRIKASTAANPAPEVLRELGTLLGEPSKAAA